MKTLVIIPTYNERENIQALIQQNLSLAPHIDILIVDDNSPDGTGNLIAEIMKQEKRVHLLSRAEKKGLGRAYLAGFEWGISHGYEALVEMDADFSHRPNDLVRLLSFIEKYDFIVGSRYVPGGTTVNWGIGRKIISRGGSLYSRFILGFPLNDWTGGFNAWKAKTLIGIDLPSVQSNGYSFQIELKFRALKKNFSGYEVPITFEDRRVGKSKMSYKIVLEALYKVWLIRFGV